MVWEHMEVRAARYIDAGDDDVVVFHHEVAPKKWRMVDGSSTDGPSVAVWRAS